MSENVYTDWEATTQEQVKQAEEADLIPTGTYEGQIQDYKPRSKDSEKAGVLFGKVVAAVTVDLFNVAGRNRKFFFEALPGVQKEDGGLHVVSRTAVQLAKHTGTVGQPFNLTLEAAKQVRLKFRIRLAEAKGGYDARNWLDAITSA